MPARAPAGAPHGSPSAPARRAHAADASPSKAKRPTRTDPAAPPTHRGRRHNRRRRSTSSRDQPAPVQDHAAAAAETNARARSTTHAPGRAEPPTPTPTQSQNAKRATTDPPQFEAIRAGCHASPSRCVLLVRDVGRDNPHPPCTGGRFLLTTTDARAESRLKRATAHTRTSPARRKKRR